LKVKSSTVSTYLDSNIFTKTAPYNDGPRKNFQLLNKIQIRCSERETIHHLSQVTLELPTNHRDQHLGGPPKNLHVNYHILLPLFQFLNQPQLPRPPRFENLTTLQTAFNLLLNGELRLSRPVDETAFLRVCRKQIQAMQSALLIGMKALLKRKSHAS
jgi:hypothetical protein